MSHVWHLVWHNLRAHRAILLAWLATVIALPILANLPWSDPLAAGFGVGAAIGLQAARVLLGMAAIASIVQAGNPIDDRAFWRTRPIAPHTLAAAHIVTAGAIFVIVPTLVVFLITVALGIPKAHWLSSIVQAGATESALAGFGLVMASRTRGIATFIVAAVVGLASLFFLLGALAELRRLLDWPGYVQMVDPLKALWAMIAMSALCLPLLFVVAMVGPRRQRAFLAGVLAVLVLCVGVWFVPALRFVPPPTVDAGLSFTETSMRVEAVPDSPGAVALVLVVRPEKAYVRDKWRFWLKSGKLRTASGITWLKGTPAGYAWRVKTPEVSTVVAVLAASEFKALAGTRVQLEAWLQGDVQRHITEATASLAAGSVLDAEHVRLSVSRVVDGAADPDRRMRPVVDATEIYLSSPRLSFRHAHAYLLRDRATGCEVSAYSWPTPASRVTQMALLPTLMPPFTVMRIELAERVPAACRVDPLNAEIEMRSIETRSAGTVPVSIEFTLPMAVPAS